MRFGKVIVMQKISGSTMLIYVGTSFFMGNFLYAIGKYALVEFGILPNDWVLPNGIPIMSTTEVLIAGFAGLYFYTQSNPYKLSQIASMPD